MKNKREEKKEEEKESFYDALGMKNTRDLSEKTLERADKKCALKYHPDRTNGNAEKFLRCTKAFETLKDTNLKAIYDKYGEEGLEPGFVPPQQQQFQQQQPFGGFQQQREWADQQRQ